MAVSKSKIGGWGRMRGHDSFFYVTIWQVNVMVSPMLFFNFVWNVDLHVNYGKLLEGALP